MKKIALSIFLFTIAVNVFAQKASWQKNTVYDIFPGDYADPSILRDGNDYYMTHSTTSLLVWHSTDLLHWKPISRALPAYSRAVWAPDLIKYNNKYFIYYPQAGKIFVVTADKPSGPWSEPVALNIPGIDPGIITTPEAKRYVYVNDGRIIELSEDGLSTKGDLKKVYNGWQYPKDWVVECFCLESPKLIYYKGYYYMTSAQGGTSGPATSHMAVVARSKSVLGPWENSPYGALVHTSSNQEAFVSKGHGTIFNDAKGEWYVAYHAYEKRQLPMGRHTLIEKIEFTKDGWFVSSNDKKGNTAYNIVPNTRIVSDNFESSELNSQWNLFGIKSSDDFLLSNGNISINGSADRLKALQLIASDNSYEATIKLNVSGNAEAGLAVFYDSSRYVGLSILNNKIAAVRDTRREEELDATGIHFLKIKMDHYDLSLQYSADGVVWKTYPSSFEMSGYQTNVLREFGSLRPSVYIKGNGSLFVDEFVYKPFP